MEKFIGTHNTKKYTSDLPRGSRFLRHRNTPVTDEAPGRSRRFNRRCFREFSSEAFHFHVNKTNLYQNAKYAFTQKELGRECAQ